MRRPRPSCPAAASRAPTAASSSPAALAPAASVRSRRGSEGKTLPQKSPLQIKSSCFLPRKTTKFQIPALGLVRNVLSRIHPVRTAPVGKLAREMKQLLPMSMNSKRYWSLLKSEDGNFESGFQLEDLGGMIQNMEKNILLLNQARLWAIEEVDKILTEKEALQKEVSILEMKLSKTLATEGNINTEILGDHLEKFTKEMSLESALFGGSPAHLCESPFDMELNVLKEENMLLKADAQFLKTKLVELSETEKCLFKLEKERALLDTTVRELESRFIMAETDIWKLAPMQYDVWMEKVANLHGMLGCLANHIGQAAALLDQNHDLHNKVNKLEASLAEGQTSGFSPYIVKLLQRKLKAARDHLQACHQETNTQIQLYQQLIEEFQEILGKPTEGSERLSVEHSTNDVPSEFWSHVLLMIDGWFLEQKISYTDANMLREMSWKR